MIWRNRWRIMKISRFLALLSTIAIAVALTGLQLALSIQVGRRIADFESQTGLTADNDFGQRGIAVGGLVMLVAWALAGLAIWKLLRKRASGLLFHSALWLVLLLAVALRPLPNVSETLYQGLHIVCLVGAISGVALSITAMALTRRRQAATVKAAVSLKDP
ncbi:hypothetical protein FDK12_13365 [Arthrobacter sp. NamB2]|uniref:hypothetical protein n=1 Tax=Arthrobacter sp. NamB2 TaxID=2576035 RepID=UPI0010C9E7EB|nr:hypothetical protein [Arthrobacter sp. NamB2]TKV26369.1 hypothetical protein FDK12_13365 [Arthrobacter sp. NamB2]